MYIANRDINPGYVGGMHFCKAPLCGRRLDLDSLNLTPRLAHRPLLLLWLVVVKKEPQGAPYGRGPRTARYGARVGVYAISEISYPNFALYSPKVPRGAWRFVGQVALESHLS